MSYVYKCVSSRLDGLLIKLTKNEKTFLLNSNLIKKQIINQNPKFTRYISEISTLEDKFISCMEELDNMIEAFKNKSRSSFLKDTPKMEKKNAKPIEDICTEFIKNSIHYAILLICFISLALISYFFVKFTGDLFLDLRHEYGYACC